jgi:Domain of unknown function (DUF4397)
MKVNYVRSLWAKPGMFLCSLVLALSLSGCMDDDDNTHVEPVPTAFVSLFHAAPDAPALDVMVGNLKITSFNYTQYTNYLPFYVGERALTFNPINADNALIQSNVSLEENKTYSVFVINKLASIETFVVEDKVAVPASGKTMVRFINLSPDAPAVDINIKDDNSALFQNQAFKQATDFKEIDADTYNFEVKATGSNNVLATVPNVTLREGGIYTIVSRGFNNPPSGNTNIFSIQVY